MTTRFTLQDLEQAAPRVLERLKGMAPLPAHGTVAGQAVASLFFEELGHTVRGPVNDIDVFVNYNLPRDARGLENFSVGHSYQSSKKTQPTTGHDRDVSVESDDYQHVKFIALRSNLNILRTYAVGLVNYTLIRSASMTPGEYGHGPDVSKAIVQGFDLNLVGVGIHLESGQVAASEGFLEFLNTAQIRVETCNTPAHTLIRLAKKFHGGEIVGARCDFESERNLLELALACQAPSTAQNVNTNLVTVTRFGGGKYKALHDKFAGVLPPVAAETEIHWDGTRYTFFSLRPDEPVLECDRALVHTAVGRGGPLPYCVLQMAYVVQFPRIYDLFHPERSRLSVDETQQRRAAFEAMDPALSNGHNLRCLQKAVGEPTVDWKVEGMDEDESAVFFFQQSCTGDAGRAQQAALAWLTLQPIERAVMTRLRQKADVVLALHEAREATWKTLLDSDGPAAIEAVGGYLFGEENCGDCLHSSPRQAAMALTREMLAWMEEMGAAGSRLVRRILPCRNPGRDNGTGLFKTLINLVPKEEQEAVALDLMRKIFPAWPDLSGEPPEARRRALAQWVDAGQSMPDLFWEALPNEELPRCIETVCETFQSLGALSPMQRQQFQKLLDRALPGLTPSQIHDREGLIWRAVLCVGGKEALARELETRPGHPWIEKTLQGLVDGLRRHTRYPDAFMLENTDGACDRWISFRDPAPLAAELERALLERAVTHAPDTRDTPKRVGLRL